MIFRHLTTRKYRKKHFHGIIFQCQQSPTGAILAETIAGNHKLSDQNDNQFDINRTRKTTEKGGSLFKSKFSPAFNFFMGTLPPDSGADPARLERTATRRRRTNPVETKDEIITALLFSTSHLFKT